MSEKSIAVPISATEVGLPIPLPEIARVASGSSPPEAEGVNVTLIWQDALTATVGVEPHRLSKEKSLAFAPVIEIDVTFSGPLPTLLNTTAFAALVVPIKRVPRSKDVDGFRLARGAFWIRYTG